MFVAEKFISNLIKVHGKHAISTDDGGGTWGPHQACKFLKLKHHNHIYLKSKASSKGQCNT
jgi:putative transposase